MQRTKHALISILATVSVAVPLAGSATASEYSSLNATLGSDRQASEQPAYPQDYASASATLQDGGTRVSLEPGRVKAVSSPTAILGDGDTASSRAGTGLGLPNAILGGRGQPQAYPVSIAASNGGFDWGDAMVGAAAAFGLVLLASGAAALSRRRRHAEIQPPVPA
jgi:hypothetical protein